MTKQCNGTSTDENVQRILKYIYNNQSFAVIKGELNEENIPSLYAQAYVCKCQNLLKHLETLIINEVLNPENATMFYLEAIHVSVLSVIF